MTEFQSVIGRNQLLKIEFDKKAQNAQLLLDYLAIYQFWEFLA